MAFENKLGENPPIFTGAPRFGRDVPYRLNLFATDVAVMRRSIILKLRILD
jgi:hypothetical protein